MPCAARERRAEGGGEDGEVHARGSDVDVVEVGAVVGDEFGGLGAGVGDQPRGAVHDPVFAVLTAARLGLFAGLQEEVLDLGHGVHGVDQRDAPEPESSRPATPDTQ